MSEQPSAPAPHDTYPFANNPASEAHLATRTAAHDGAFFLPHLRAEMRLLDCGSGPGSITVGLAQAIEPGPAVGIDMQPHVVDAARALAAERGVTNVTFEVGRIYEIPFPDASFDAVFAHMLLMHLTEPLRALKEMWRVLRPGGVIGIRDFDVYSGMFSPADPLLDEIQTSIHRSREAQGFAPDYPRNQRHLLSEAGFARTEGYAQIEFAGTIAKTRAAAVTFRRIVAAQTPELIRLGLQTQEQLDAMQAAVQAWGERPDAMRTEVIYAAVGWVAQ